MKNVKPYVIVAVLLGAGFLVYGLAFLSSKVAPQSEVHSSQIMLALTETIAAVVACIVAVLGGMYYFTKKSFNQMSQHQHRH